MLQKKVFVFNPFAENTYLVYDTNGDCAVIDPGNSNAFETRQLCSFIEDNHLTVKYLLITHGHIDHVVGVSDLVSRYGAKVMAHPESSSDLKRVAVQSRAFGFGRGDEEVTVDESLQDGTLLQMGEGVLKVILTPGHAEGSVSFYAPAEGWVFTGDALFCRSIGRTDFPGGNFETLRASIRTRLFALPDDTEVFSGHGESTTIGEEKDFNPYVAV